LLPGHQKQCSEVICFGFQWWSNVIKLATIQWSISVQLFMRMQLPVAAFVGASKALKWYWKIWVYNDLVRWPVYQPSSLHHSAPIWEWLER